MQAEECLTELLAQVKCVGPDFFFEDIDNFFECLDELVIVNVIDQLEVDANDVLQAWSNEFDSDRVIQELDKRDSSVDSRSQIVGLQALVDIVQSMPQVVFILEGEVSKLAVNPASTCLHEAILTCELREHILLQHSLSVCHILLRVGHVLGQES